MPESFTGGAVTSKQQEDRINADLTKRLQEKLAKVQTIEGKVLTNDKKPESANEEC